MSRRTKHLGVLFLAQIACVGVGLWMNHRFVVSTTVRKTEQRAWSRLEQAAESMAAALPAAWGSDGSAQISHAKPFSGFESEMLADQPRFLIVDDQWQVLFPEEASAIERQRNQPASLAWKPAKPTDGKVNELRGTIDLADEVHLAVARPLRGGNGHLVAYRPKSACAAEAAALLEPLPALGELTFVWTSALMGLAVYVITAKFHDVLDREQSRSATETIRQAQQLVRARDAVIFGLAKLAESRDPDTGDHLERISVYSTTFAAALRRHPQFAHEVSPAFVQLIGISSALHDIGKVGVEDRILRKPSALSAEERAAMQSHAAIGGACLREIEQRLGGSNFLQMAREIALCHHEQWDGGGYPLGLSGESIPLSARIVAIADIYDALSSRRIYKESIPHEECVKCIRKEAGKKLDPTLVEIWLTVEPRFREIAARFVTQVGRPDRPQAIPFASQTDALGEPEAVCAAVNDRTP